MLDSLPGLSGAAWYTVGSVGWDQTTVITYPFKADPPRVMGEPPQDHTNFKDRNPVGSYRRNFTISPMRTWK
jgi:hypothetical protein